MFKELGERDSYSVVPGIQQTSERDEAEERELCRPGGLYRQDRTSPRCFVLPPGVLYGCIISTLGPILSELKYQNWQVLADTCGGYYMY